MFLVNGAVTAFYENGTITHYGANSDAKEQVPSAALLVQASLTTKTQCGGQNAILVDIAPILQLKHLSTPPLLREPHQVACVGLASLLPHQTDNPGAITRIGFFRVIRPDLDLDQRHAKRMCGTTMKRSAWCANRL